MPIWLSVLAVLAVMSFFGFAAWVWGTADSTLVIVVRHAEQESAGADPPLSALGQARATLLSRMFGSGPTAGGIEAIYDSPTLRDRMTAAPLAERLGLTPRVTPDDAPALARRVLHEHGGGSVLVVGRRDTMIPLVEALSGARHLSPIGEWEYGTLYIVSVPRIGRANVLRVAY